jgi:DNA-binding NarL/FixJ family response regulator
MKRRLPSQFGSGELRDFEPLTSKDIEVAYFVHLGLTNRQIAETLGQKEQSIKNRVRSLYMKTGADNRVDFAVRVYPRMGISDLGPMPLPLPPCPAVVAVRRASA